MSINVRARMNSRHYDELLQASSMNGVLQVDDASIKSWAPPVNGTVYGTLLNDRKAVEAMGQQLNAAPYKQPPKAPVLYIKPINTLAGHQSDVELPLETDELHVGASIGIVIGKQASKISEKEAYDFIEGYTLVNDISIPHDNVFRPAIKEKARDGFCPIGPWVVSYADVTQPEDLEINVYVNGDHKQQFLTEDLVRPIPKLLQDVTEFMTLFKGDVLMIGCGHDLPKVTAGDTVRIESAELGVLENKVRRVQS
ncbi:2-hydroxyhepta-2,4-diene-1,7-dioate isomerase [Halobacillus andaensis]|uniref:2-hydroxyhepta-2,4-diene-1,7-dioate isomerase n=1 Tax=Halobacillus andaensis TaxID=1176239 RepID=A0A917B028_HALAA|nr:fumarylacetoacetate hydrolase family protein [Halobacillus andaensis]MBP2003902.1 5-oxopent-3-ene-1,2,5-tricarboxylate decarboxylase/2-hydroxyhepta-2,4-diene-1,7-dioate isomerase [Halobacillus andaensis]GGF14152.1 2-hydroxyhepta-2,4-diene-1,7-dioate isomerase [Halobacillus andaensis]